MIYNHYDLDCNHYDLGCNHYDLGCNYKQPSHNKPKPKFLKDAMDMLHDKAEMVVERPRLEADDLMSMMLCQGWCCIAIDKDMRTVPGWHWNPRKEDNPIEVSEEDAVAFERIQTVTGDSTDNIFGILGRGEAWAKKQNWHWPSILQENRDAFNNPSKRYVEKRDRIINEAGISDADEYFEAQYKCLHLLPQAGHENERATTLGTVHLVRRDHQRVCAKCGQ